MQHKGRGKKYLTEEEIRIAEEKKLREKEWKVGQDIIMHAYLSAITYYTMLCLSAEEKRNQSGRIL